MQAGVNKSKIDIAKEFGQSLDADQFERTASVLEHNCEYIIGDDKLKGPEKICNSYEQNMLAGRKKLDRLEWGKSRIEELSESEFYVHFIDYLTHKGTRYTHRCKQKIFINEENRIYKIEHINDPREKERLNSYYDSVGLPRSK